MNQFLLFQRKLMAWGNPEQLDELNEYGKRMGFWESYEWKVKNSEDGE